MAKLLKFIVAAFLGFSLGVGFCLPALRVLSTHTLAYKVQSLAFSWPEFVLCGVAGAFALSVLLWLFLRAGAKAGRDPDSWLFSLAACPLALLLPLAFFPPGFASLIAGAFLTALACFRLLAAWPVSLFERGVFPAPLAWTALGFMTLFCAGFSYLLQVRAYDGMMLGVDWEVFLNVVSNTLHGDWFVNDVIARNSFGQHFEPGMVLLLSPFVWLFPCAQTIFIINSVALYSGLAGLFLLARHKGCGYGEALALAALFALHPSLSSMSTDFFYGFHESHLAIPLAIFFFLALERNCLKTAFAIFLLSLSLKETLPAFWGCAGLVLAFDKPRRAFGFAIAATSLVYFSLVQKLVIPWIGGGQYEYINMYYSQLGSSFGEIALSPFLRPAAFWGLLFRPENFLFLALLALPGVFAGAARSRWYLSCGGILLFLFLKGSAGNSINTQYQGEILGMLGVVPALGFFALAGLDGSFMRSFPLAWGLGRDAAIPSRKLAQAALAASLLGSAFIFYFFALGCPGGRNEWNKGYLKGPDFSRDFASWKALVPPGSWVSVDARLRSHFIPDNRISPLEFPAKEYAMLDLDDDLDNGMETFRRRLIASGKYSLLRFGTVKNHTWLLFKRETPAKPLPQTVFKLDAKAFESFGSLVAANEFVSARATILPPGQGSARPGFKPALLFARLEKRPEADFALVFRFDFVEGGSKRSLKVKAPFAHGALPAYMAEPGDCYKIPLEIPASGAVSMGVEFKNSVKPDFSLPPF